MLALRPTTLEVYLRREFAAPRAAVFAAWTDERLIARWWASRAYTTLACKMDVRPGGGWHRRMRVPDGSVVAKWGAYREVVVPERLVFTYINYFDEHEMVVTLDFTERSGKTEMRFHQAPFISVEERDSHGIG